MELTNTQAALTEQPWSTVQKVAFRFAFSYLCLYLYPFSHTLGWYWWFWINWGAHETLWRQLVPWVGTHILRLNYPVAPGASGDSPYEYVRVFCLLLVAAFVTVVWSFLDRKRRTYTTLHQWIRFWVRIIVATTLIGFGALKIIPMQMLSPGLTTLMRPFGDLGPWPPSLLWNFMGSSTGYVIMCGIVEASAGILLLIPGMTTLGALLAVGAVLNVFVMRDFMEFPFFFQLDTFFC